PWISTTGKVHSFRHADQHDLDLTRIRKLGFDAAGDILSERCHASIVDFLRSNYHAHLATSLNGEDFLDAPVARRDFLETFQSLDVGLECFAPRTRARAGNSICSLNQH